MQRTSVANVASHTSRFLTVIPMLMASRFAPTMGNAMVSIAAPSARHRRDLVASRTRAGGAMRSLTGSSLPGPRALR